MATRTVANGFTHAGVLNLDSLSAHQANFNVTNGEILIISGGSINVNTGAGGPRSLGASFTNNGAINVNTDAFFNKTNGVVTNNNQPNIAGGATLTYNSGNETFDLNDGGAIAVTGDFHITSGTFNFNGGNLTRNSVEITGGKLNMGPGVGSGTVLMRNSTTYSGDVDPGQTISVIATGTTGSMTAAEGYTNNGLINITSTSVNASNLNVTLGELVNNATVNIEPGGGGGRSLAASFTNNSVMNINTDAGFNKTNGIFNNNSQINIVPGATLIYNSSNETFNQNAGGTVEVLGGFEVTNGVFNLNVGSLTGNSVEIAGGTLNMGPGELHGSVILRGSCLYRGDLDPNMTVIVKAVGTTATFTAANGFAVNDVLDVTSDTVNTVNVAVTNGNLVNEGLINIEPGTGGTRSLALNLINNGIVNINTDTTMDKTNGVFANHSLLTIAAGKTLSYNAASETFRQAAGVLDVQGDFSGTSGTFELFDGSITGNRPVLGTIRLSIDPNSTAIGNVVTRSVSVLTGDVKAGQVIDIESSGATSTLTSTNGFINGGTITLDSVTTHTSQLVVSNDAFTNAGQFIVNPG